MRKGDGKCVDYVIYQNSQFGILLEDWNLGRHKEVWQTLWEWKEVPLELACGLDFKKQGMFDVDQDKVIRVLRQQIMTYVPG